MHPWRHRWSDGYQNALHVLPSTWYAAYTVGSRAIDMRHQVDVVSVLLTSLGTISMDRNAISDTKNILFVQNSIPRIRGWRVQYIYCNIARVAERHKAYEYFCGWPLSGILLKHCELNRSLLGLDSLFSGNYSCHASSNNDNGDDSQGPDFDDLKIS